MIKSKALASAIVLTALELAACFPSLFQSEPLDWQTEPDFYR
jgi:hypothetical protein